jgi:hypothetical protein
MAKRVSARLIAAQRRRFGLTVGGAFLALAAVVYWRGPIALSVTLAALGGALSLAAIVVPTLLGPVERFWTNAAHAMSKVTTPIVMAAMYVLVLTPIGFMRRTMGGNPLSHIQGEHGYWKDRPAGQRRSGSMRRQF